MEKFLITGSSKGIGLAAKNHFSQNNNVVGISRSKQESSENFNHYQIDLSDIKNLSHNIKKLLSHHPDINNFILNAGLGNFKELDQFSEAEIHELLKCKSSSKYNNN